MNFEEESIPIHVEICLKDDSIADDGYIKNEVLNLLEISGPTYKNGFIDFTNSEILLNHVIYIEIVDLDLISNNTETFSSSTISPTVSLWDSTFILHIFILNEDDPEKEYININDNNNNDNMSNALPVCDQYILPSKKLNKLWPSLILPKELKNKLLNYVNSAMIFSDYGIDNSLITWNRVVFLHGPPGTGKTTLCKALANKLCIRLGRELYPEGGILLEINAHSLFSKWFSESGKLVMKLFSHIQDLLEDTETFICILIDEVESLTRARSASSGGTEPSDAVRVVNAVLTQLDAIASYPNVLVFATSNLSEAIDLAFVDRADMKQYIPLPPLEARYSILEGCLKELIRVGLIQQNNNDNNDNNINNENVNLMIYSWHDIIENKIHEIDFNNNDNNMNEENNDDDIISYNSKMLYKIAFKSEGLSGRALRKLPFQAHAYFLPPIISKKKACTLMNDYLNALYKAVKYEQQNRNDLKIKSV